MESACHDSDSFIPAQLGLETEMPRGSVEQYCHRVLQSMLLTFPTFSLPLDYIAVGAKTVPESTAVE